MAGRMSPEIKSLCLPASADEIRQLNVGDAVRLNGNLLTGRDKAHKWLTDLFITQAQPASAGDLEIFEEVSDNLRNGGIYHCGPIVEQLPSGEYRMLAAGPTTSSREEPYQADLIARLGLRVVIGKGGMGERTREACLAHGAIYCHAIGGAAVSTADTIVNVEAVYKLEFGVPEAMWLITVKDFPAVVTIDAHGNSLHQQVYEESAQKLKQLLASQINS